jgi:hypothetical protein
MNSTKLSWTKTRIWAFALLNREVSAVIEEERHTPPPRREDNLKMAIA